MLLRPSRFFTWLAEWVSDVEDWWCGEGSWETLRERREHPPTSEFIPPDTSGAPFHMPPDVERLP